MKLRLYHHHDGARVAYREAGTGGPLALPHSQLLSPPAGGPLVEDSHHPDGARVAYREAGTGRPLALLHSKLLSPREWEPVVEELSHRYRLVLPDLPLHGDSEDRPTPPYTPQWFAEVMAGFIRDTCG